MAYRTCKDCGLEAHTREELLKFKKSHKMKFGRENLCNKCSNKRYGKGPEYHKKYYEENKDKINEQKREREKNNFIFKGKIIRPKVNPRTNKCFLCEKRYPDELEKQTAIHHIVYDFDNPMAGTIELCNSCHAKLHKIQKLR